MRTIAARSASRSSPCVMSRTAIPRSSPGSRPTIAAKVRFTRWKRPSRPVIVMPIAASSKACSGIAESSSTYGSSAGAGRTARLRAVLSLRTVRATRYATPLREGGSLPGVVEADDDGMYVVKFRGAGQGVKALVAEIVAGELGRAVGLDVPEIVLVEIDPVLGRAEPDPEIQELIEASAGLNVGLDFLPSALPYDAAFPVSPQLAALVVWLDELTLNIDRTPRNPNLLVWHERLWLIDHGAALFPHHAGDIAAAARRDFTAIADHVLAAVAGPRPQPSFDAQSIVSLVPAQWLDVPAASYVSFLEDR